MLASDYFLRWGKAAHLHPEPLSFSEAVSGLAPHIRPAKRLVKAIARWDQGRDQVRFSLELAFEGTSALDIRWGSVEETLRGRKTRTIDGVDLIRIELEAEVVYRFLEAHGYQITWPDMRVAEEAELEKHINLPRGVGYRRSPTETATTASLDWGYRGPKFRL